MNTFEDKVLSAVDRLSEHLGPLTMLSDGFLARFCPQATAHACAGCPADFPFVCWEDCYECTPDAIGTISYCSEWTTSCATTYTFISCDCC